MEAAFIEQARQQQPLNGTALDASHYAASDSDTASQRQPPVPVQQLGSNHVRQVQSSTSPCLAFCLLRSPLLPLRPPLLRARALVRAAVCEPFMSS